MKKDILIIGLLIMTTITVVAQEKEFPKLTGPYLGQKPPGITPEVFALGIISVDSGLHSTPVFSPDGKMVFWTNLSGELFYMEEKEYWSEPRPAWFLRKSTNGDVPFFSDDGKKLYFISDLDDRIWYIEKTGKWTEPIPLQMELEGEQLHWQFSFSTIGTLYFTATVDDGKGGYGRYDIYKSEYINNKYKKPELLGGQINTSESDLAPYIAPDESYLIFSSARPGGFGRTDLYICYRNRDRSWTRAINLGPEINTSSDEICPIVTKEGKFLFFLGKRNGISGVYWVDARILEKLKPKE